MENQRIKNYIYCVSKNVFEQSIKISSTGLIYKNGLPINIGDLCKDNQGNLYLIKFGEYEDYNSCVNHYGVYLFDESSKESISILDKLLAILEDGKYVDSKWIPPTYQNTLEKIIL